MKFYSFFFFFSSRRRHTRLQGDWSSDVCSSDLQAEPREHLDQIEPLAQVHWSGVREAGLDRGWPETGASGSDSPARTRDARNTRGSDSPGPAGYARGVPGFIDCPTR